MYFGNFPQLVGRYCCYLQPSRPSKLAKKNITKYDKGGDARRCRGVVQISFLNNRRAICLSSPSTCLPNFDDRGKTTVLNGWRTAGGGRHMPRKELSAPQLIHNSNSAAVGIGTRRELKIRSLERTVLVGSEMWATVRTVRVMGRMKWAQ